MAEEKSDWKETWEELRMPFPADRILSLPKPTKADNPKGSCGVCHRYHGLPAVHLDYVSHADVTDRLLAVDPFWNWEPIAFDEDGLPRFVRTTNGAPVGLWIKLSVHLDESDKPMTRLGFGSVTPGAFDAEKQLIGDALRNAAMRFGVALDLWRKDLDESAADAPPAAQPAPKRSKELAATVAHETLSDRMTEAVRVLREEGFVTARMVELLRDFNVGPGRRVSALTLKEQIHLLGELLVAREAVLKASLKEGEVLKESEFDQLLKEAIKMEAK